MKRVTDERIHSESNKIYSVCFYILCAGVLLDLILKFNFYRFDLSFGEIMLSFGIELLLVVAVFYANLFLLASRGILFGASGLELARFPKGRCLCVSATAAGIVSAGMWGIRILTGSWEYGLAWAILFWAIILSVTFLSVFAVLLLSLYLAWRVAKRACQTDE